MRFSTSLKPSSWKKAWAWPMDRAQTSAMDLPAMVTARLSGRRRPPPQSGQAVRRISASSLARRLRALMRRYRSISEGMMPSQGAAQRCSQRPRRATKWHSTRAPPEP